MKLKSFVSTALITTILASCGTNSSEKETTTTSDTADVSTIDSTTLQVDTPATVAVNVPEKTRKNFEKKYPEAKDVKWKTQQVDTRSAEWDLPGSETGEDGEGHTAIFHWQGNDRAESFDKKGEWVSTTEEVNDPKSLPAAVTSSINKQFSGYTVVSVTRENDKDRTEYEVVLNKNGQKVKALMDGNGMLIKKKNLD